MAELTKTQFSELVYHYDVDLLARYAAELRRRSYSALQYIPTQPHPYAIGKEHTNLLNVALRRRHALFSTTAFPGIYRRTLSVLNPDLETCFAACFLNEALPRDVVTHCFGEDLVAAGLGNQVILERNGLLRFTACFVPFKSDIFIRDRCDSYRDWLDFPVGDADANTHGPPLNDLVWMGSDSTAFSEFLMRYLQGKRLERALELGSGTGLPIVSVSRIARQCVAIDINPRAVQFTQLNARLNAALNIDVFKSDLFEQVTGKFDLVLANPWFEDLETGGLEEVPEIVAGLNEHLEDDGVCLLILQSYIKHGKDTGLEFLSQFAKEHRYDLELFTVGYNLKRDVETLNRYGIHHGVVYYVLLRRGGRGEVIRHECSLARRIRDRSYIEIRHAVARAGR